MYNTLVINMIKDTLKRICDKYGKDIPPIAIYPFGKDGMFVKYILNNQFGIEEKYLVDNSLNHYNSRIISSKQLFEINDKTIVIVGTTSEKINLQLQEEIKTCNNTNLIVESITDPIILPLDNTPYYKELIKAICIKKISGFDYIRVGRLNDGGYIMINDFDERMRAYSFGINDDMSWDICINEMSGMHVNMYDHTIPCPPQYHKGCTFIRRGIGSCDDEEHALLSLATMLDKNGDSNGDMDLILKMDIEGAEWDVLEMLPESILNRFRQMVFEFHDMTDKSNNGQRQRLNVLNKLNKTHQIAWIHGNNYSPAAGEGDLIIPDALEVLYLNRNCYEFSEDRIQLPLTMDMPNMPGRKDFDLSYFCN